MNRIDPHPVLNPLAPAPTVSFQFDGQPCQGRAGEMISTALFALGYKTFSVHRRDDAAQGIYCANGQCAQCTLVVDGYPRKSCVTPLRAGMDIRTLRHLPALPADDRPLGECRPIGHETDVLVVGGGPAGLMAAAELGRAGLSVLLADDKDRLGGKLVLQSHKFFGSIADCHAGTRGVDIAARLEEEVRSLPNVTVWTDASVVGVYRDQRVGVFVGQDRYALVGFRGLVVTTGARERTLVFPGNTLPGVYGAGAFQTLVNRDRVRAAQRVFIVGSGNVGLIAAYHALQAGIEVAGIVDILDRPAGYKVHADKIRRMGVPIHLRHTVVCAEGEGRVERVTIAEVDGDGRPLLETARTWAVDTLLLAVGLAPVDEFARTAEQFGFPVESAGDAQEIAEASSAMFGGRLAGLRMAERLGRPVVMDGSYADKAELLKSHPGDIFPSPAPTLSDRYRPVLHCLQEIPCNPCADICPVGAIRLTPRRGNLMDVPEVVGEACTGCGLCVAVCPGLAITLTRQAGQGEADVVLAHEFLPNFRVGDELPLADLGGAPLPPGRVQALRRHRKSATWLVTVRVAREVAGRVAGIRVQPEAAVAPLAEASFDHLPEDGIVCRCERVTLGEVVDHIRRHRIDDVNQLKQIRVGMGACGGKTCHSLLARVFRLAGADWSRVSPGTVRPLDVEVPMGALINEAQAEEVRV